jgi:hypothetical protein
LLEVSALFVAHVGSFPLAVSFFGIFVLKQNTAASLVNGFKNSLTDEWQMKMSLVGGAKHESGSAVLMETSSC